MPRLMSVAHTLDSVRARRKDVTRRLGWKSLPPGVDLDLCEKVMGRKAGDPLVRIARVRVVQVGRERLDQITPEDVYREGFTDEDLATWPTDNPPPFRAWSPDQWFLAFYADRFLGLDVVDNEECRRAFATEVTRIEWRYVFDFDRFTPAPVGPAGEDRWWCRDCIPAIQSRELHDAAHHLPVGSLVRP